MKEQVIWRRTRETSPPYSRNAVEIELQSRAFKTSYLTHINTYKKIYLGHPAIENFSPENSD
jgi:hypothetical protein